MPHDITLISMIAVIRCRPARRLEASGQARFAVVTRDLEHARAQATAKVAARGTVTPEELVQRFPLFADVTPAARGAVPALQGALHRIGRSRDRRRARADQASGGRPLR
jgi:hypothetical protein